MPILLALGSAIIYGIADYCGGRASRFQPSVIVTVVGQMVSLILLGIVVAVMGTAAPDTSTILWGLFGGVAGSIALVSLYYSFSHGAMTVVAPISAVVGAVLPVAVGIATGERPAQVAYLGIVLAIAAVALISGAIGERHQPTPPRIMWIAAAAGLGFGCFFVALDRAASDSGLWPLLTSRLASVPLLVVICLATGARAGRPRRMLGLAAFGGALDMSANLLYLAATRGGLMSLVAVVGSMYPASTVMLAFVIDRERVNRWQAAGMALAALSLAFVTLGRS